MFQFNGGLSGISALDLRALACSKATKKTASFKSFEREVPTCTASYHQ
jgi:hypothetical protein